MQLYHSHQRSGSMGFMNRALASLSSCGNIISAQFEESARFTSVEVVHRALSVSNTVTKNFVGVPAGSFVSNIVYM